MAEWAGAAEVMGVGSGDHDLIAAVASARGTGERAIVRLSGARTRELVESLCRPRGATGDPGGAALELTEREAHRAWFDDGECPVPLDVLWMPGPRSFTAEDVAELHLPGHPELVTLVLRRVLGAGARLAEPGEFTRRAFENGRIDLTQAEGVAALVAARSSAERRAATALLVGGLEVRIRGIRDALERVRALSEASLDFDEADTGHVPTEALVEMTEQALAGVREALGWERQRTASAVSFEIVLAGAPNAGKSTLFNRLVEPEAMEVAGPALVSDLAGTTRDAKRGEWRLGDGLTAALFDVAGLGESAPAGSEPDRLALDKAKALVARADLVLWVSSAEGLATGARTAPVPSYLASVPAGRILRVWAKVDLVGNLLREQGAGSLQTAEPVVSAKEGEGLEALLAAVRGRLGFPSAADGAAPAESSHTVEGLGARHLAALEGAAARAGAALEGLRAGIPLDLVAEDLRLGTDLLDGIAGRTVPEDLLDRIFAQFCLGK